MVRCALALPNGKAYLFEGTTYSRYDFRSGSLEASGVSISPNWPGLPATAPDAAVYWGYGKVYFFYGTEYIRYDLGLNPALAEGVDGSLTPIPSGWTGVGAAPLDAVLNWGTGKIYFFRGTEYFRYDVTFERVDPGYPLPIAGNWPGVWGDGIDDAMYQGGRYAYFFKGDEYRRYDVYTDTVDETGNLSGLVLDPVPAGMLTAGRHLTLSDAREVMGYLIDQGKLGLDPVRTPYSGPWNSISTPAATTRVVIKPAIIDGVAYQNELGPAPIIDNVDQRMLAVLYRLTRWMKASESSLSMIKHLGIGHGSGPADDCHNQGRALDFSGFESGAGNRNIQIHWGNRPTVAGSALRLNEAVDPLAYTIFQVVHRFATHECECNGIGPANSWPAKNIGDTGGFVIHPDYVDVASGTLRSQHQNHIHMQVGKTRG